jgi:hypothetical protein
MIHRISMCASKEKISGFPRCRCSEPMRCSIMHVRVGVWRRTSDWFRPKALSRCSLRERGPKVSYGKSPNSVLGEDPQTVMGAVVDAVNRGVPAVELARHPTLAAARRLARFPASNGIEDWSVPFRAYTLFRSATRFIVCWHGVKQGRKQSAVYSTRPCPST